MPNEISVVFHNGSHYDYHITIKELANEFQGNLNVLGKLHKSTKLFFFLSIEKEVVKIDKDGNETVVTMSYKIIERFMATSLSNLLDNLKTNSQN